MHDSLKLLKAHTNRQTLQPEQVSLLKLSGIIFTPLTFISLILLAGTTALGRLLYVGLTPWTTEGGHPYINNPHFRNRLFF